MNCMMSFVYFFVRPPLPFEMRPSFKASKHLGEVIGLSSRREDSSSVISEFIECFTYTLLIAYVEIMSL